MRIVFCGVGAIGSTAALLCRNLDATLVFVDFDRVESKNLLSQAYVKPSVGKNKAEALKLQLHNLHGVKAEAFGVRLTRDNVEALCRGADLLVDAFDNQDSRQLLSGHARKTGTPLVHGAVSADGMFGLVRWDERFTPDAEDTHGQATCEGGEHLPLLGLLAATLARAVQDFLKHGVKRDAFVNLNSVTPQG
ncbi:HesA/MoeB/ThiF family protein [Corallococcus interemptor]|uniref:HesA/MoeB/ThiF family protein n=1 Tax=Corallococcus interemptor TaxID=2316720 RepID=UPI003D04CE1D